MRGGVIAPHKDLRDALYEKSRRYGALEKPYLIAVADRKNKLFNTDSIHSALTDAVFGDEIVQFKGGTVHIIRGKNGFWHGPNGPRNKHGSGILLLPETGLWKLREEKWQPVLAVNPWADHPPPDALREMNRFEADGDKWVFRDGMRFADIIGLPEQGRFARLFQPEIVRKHGKSELSAFEGGGSYCKNAPAPPPSPAPIPG
jgi:hypothetical protein